MDKKDLKISLISRKMSYIDFEKFINTVNSDFHPAFLTYVDLKAYYKKIMEYAEVIVCSDNSEIVGLAVFYCNNLETKEGYIAFVAVRKEYRELHIATDLMNRIIEFSRERGMETLKIRTNNPIALECYKKIDYKLYDEFFEKENGLIRYYLVKKL